MKLIFFLCLITIVVLIYLLVKNSKLDLLLTILFSGIIIYIILNPKASISYTINGAKLFFYSVFPSLFPFLVIVNLIFTYGGIEIYSKLIGKILCTPLKLPKECSVVLLSSMFCGYPLGARYAARLYEMGSIDKNTFERLLNIATNGSPLFIIGTVGTAMLHNTSLGYILIISNIISCFLMGIILPKNKNSKSLCSITLCDADKSIAATKTQYLNFGISLKNALEDATKTCISIGSFVIIFSVIINMIKSSKIYITALSFLCNSLHISSSIVDGILLGFIEITNGCNIISLSSLSMIVKVCICSFLIGFSGISITFQVYSFIYKHKVSMKKYVLLKIFQGLLCSLITFIILQLPLSIWAEDVFLNSDAVSSYKVGLMIPMLVVFILPIVLANMFKRTTPPR